MEITIDPHRDPHELGGVSAAALPAFPRTLEAEVGG